MRQARLRDADGEFKTSRPVEENQDTNLERAGSRAIIFTRIVVRRLGLTIQLVVATMPIALPGVQERWQRACMVGNFALV